MVFKDNFNVFLSRRISTSNVYVIDKTIIKFDYVINEEWRHLELSRKDNVLSIGGLNSKDQARNILYSGDVHDVVLYSTGFWKIHTVSYLHTNQIIKKQKTTVVVQPKNGVVCLSLFVKMCLDCKLILTLREESDENNILKAKTYSSAQNIA
jgi:hypothetical protein